MAYTISTVLKDAIRKLAFTTSEVPILEAEILLAHVLQASRAYLHTWPERSLSSSQEELYFSLIEKRLQGEPIAYLIGHKEFWSLDLLVTPDVLIPRPETELLVDLVLKNIHAEEAIIADLGTGSGAIALALAHDRPKWEVHATDASSAALNIAKQNAKRLQLSNIVFHQGIWCEALPTLKYDAIVSNPPYIAGEDEHLNQGDLRFEPKSALVSDECGLKDLHQIICEARTYLKPGGFLLLEHGFEQAHDVATFFEKSRYTSITRYSDLSGLDRVTIAIATD